MIEFTEEMHTWAARSGQLASADRDNTDHWDFFGDEYTWNSLVPLAWSLIDNPFVKLSPPQKNQSTSFVDLPGQVAAWWMAPLHLLTMGMGWADVAKGLQGWAIRGYETDHHILRFIKENWGPSIEALEIYLTGPAGAEIARVVSPESDFHYLQSREFDFVRAERFKEEHSQEDWFWLAEPLIDLNGGWDNLHLTRHFAASFEDDSQGRLSDDESVEADRGGIWVTYDRYKGWSNRALQELLSYVDQADPDGILEPVHVQIKNLGYMGTFKYGFETKRLERVGDDREPINGPGFWNLIGA